MIELLKNLLMLVGVVVALAVFASLANGGKANASSTKTDPSINSSSTQSPSIIPIGTFADVKRDRAVQVELSEIVDSISSGNEFMKTVDSKGGKLAVVYMTIKNTGKESGSMFWSKFQLIDSQGRKYDEIQDFEEQVSINMWLESKSIEKASGQLFPGATAKIAKVFRIAPDTSDLKLVADRKTFSVE